MNPENIAMNVGMLGDQSLIPLAFGGHALFCRKFTTGEQYDENFWNREIGGISIPQSVVDTSLRVEVIAIGPKVGLPASKAHRIKFDRARWFGDYYRVGQILLCPEMDIGIKRMSVAVPGWCNYEFQIEESVPIAILPPEN